MLNYKPATNLQSSSQRSYFPFGIHYMLQRLFTLTDIKHPQAKSRVHKLYKDISKLKFQPCLSLANSTAQSNHVRCQTTFTAPSCYKRSTTDGKLTAQIEGYLVGIEAITCVMREAVFFKNLTNEQMVEVKQKLHAHRLTLHELVKLVS